MKLSVNVIATQRHLDPFCHFPVALIVRCLGFGFNQPMIGGTWTKAIDNAELEERFAFNDLSCGSIVGYLSQLGLNRYKRSGERMRLAMLT